MYQALLTRRYLTSKIMPLLAAVAVVLCTAMVLIVWSVMGGFLARFIDQGRTMIGDVSVGWPNAGFAYYEDLAQRLEDDPLIEATAPMIETYGILVLPQGLKQTVLIKGVEGASFARVTDYEDTIYWRALEESRDPEDARTAEWLRTEAEWEIDRVAGLTLSEPVAQPDGSIEMRPAIVPGIEVSGYNIRRPTGIYVPGSPRVAGEDGSVSYSRRFLLDEQVTLHAIPLDTEGQAVEMVTRVLPVANEFETGLLEVDQNTVIVNLDLLQRMLGMDEGRRIVGELDPFAVVTDPVTGEQTFNTEPPTETDPARVTRLLIRAADGVDADTVKARAAAIYEEFAAAHPGEVPLPPGEAEGIRMETWRDANRTLIAAVEKETQLVLFIFSFISSTAAFLVLAIFWSMISEKTRDIGVLRSLGASRAGVAWVWVRYGVAIGVVGSVLGLALAYAVVLNINTIHDWMGAVLGVKIWDPAVYYFTRIPSEVDPAHAVMVFLGGVFASVVGALIPALRAAHMDPVKALRFE